ncbi:hypothetical protein DL239_02310 [Sedimentitalea sp. CY04]|uniref:Cyclic nucleotide-binding domain-containing protein n=1 Tax=Parasedimentitalea denitrificans TaxID=2211118 RepID=A0ABX0W2N7_9RHOB|nr:cyclic nucleotide-binding domain-containing protein [Sedimentitalea sp. CY04]NIZ59804.1 hypothetical protein [Sedimentitalea sp. CY04]
MGAAIALPKFGPQLMLEISPLNTSLLVHAGLAFYIVGLITRDDLWLRIYILVGSGCYIVYYFLISSGPLWDAIAATSVIAAVNIVMIFRLLWERSLFGLSPKYVVSMEDFPSLNPGQVRALIRLAVQKEAAEDLHLTIKNEVPKHLFYLLSGETVLSVEEGEYALEARKFVGEISFLRDQPASADVISRKGSIYLSWDRASLKKALNKSPRLSNSLIAHFNAEMAEKLARAVPEASSLRNR